METPNVEGLANALIEAYVLSYGDHTQVLKMRLAYREYSHAEWNSALRIAHDWYYGPEIAAILSSQQELSAPAPLDRS
jgi:hypothetical protein